ncbi:prenylcysteine oxidase 1-like [Eudromia elegans]
MRIPALLLLLLPAALCPSAAAQRREQRAPPSRIAVVGGGIGGSAAAHFLRQRFGSAVAIDVFERADVGGRLATVRVEGRDYEAGGSVIHPLNLHMKNFVTQLGLDVAPVPSSLLGIYNGEEFVFEQSSWYIVNILKLLWHYGLNPLRRNMWLEEILDKFMRVYRYQTHDYTFSSNERLLHALGGNNFIQMLNQTIDEHMQEAGFSQKFINEVIGPVMRVNYGQGVNMNAFVGIISLTGVEPGIWSVKGGNKLVCSGLIHAAKAQLISGTVLSIEPKTRPDPAGGTQNLYYVTYNSTSGSSAEMYDIVLIATPLNNKMSNITFRNFNPPIPEFSNPYRKSIVTFVHGRLNTSFFGYHDPSAFHLSDISTLEKSKLFFNGMGLVSPVGDRPREERLPLRAAVWRMFSNEPLSKEQLNLLFSSYDSVTEKKWLAYPHYRPPQQCPPVILHDRIYYLNGIEWAASAMEMSAVAAKNAALLAYHRWYGNMDKIDQEDLHEKLKTEL